MILLGLYVHIPFCRRKCGYCDFYSINYDKDTAKTYVDAVKSRLSKIDKTFDTVYFGGGTPSIIGSGVADILSTVRFSENAEITAECNPDSATDEFLSTAAESGVNRLSIGLQSANDSELKLLTRPHTSASVKSAVERARMHNINNISLDVMLGFKGQTKQSLERTIDFCAELEVNHISAYMLKVEERTPFAKIDDISLDGDEIASLYDSCCERLSYHGYGQYEISNFAKSGFECRHNLIYWNCDDYIGLGPAAHSLYDGKRYYYERNLNDFIGGCQPIYDDDFGGRDEYIMLRLRLNDGLNFSEFEKRGFSFESGFLDRCKTLEKAGLLLIKDDRISLTHKGFLVQNSVLTYLL